jgi:hypothetical protein
MGVNSTPDSGRAPFVFADAEQSFAFEVGADSNCGQGRHELCG